MASGKDMSPKSDWRFGTMPGSVPARSDTVLVTSQTFNAAGWAQDVTDPRGLVTRSLYDNVGEVTQTVEACDGGAITDTGIFEP